MARATQCTSRGKRGEWEQENVDVAEKVNTRTRVNK
jgi:hypothetical protein